MIFRKIILICFVIFISTHSFAQEGKELFQTHCVACHTIGKGRLVGPDLKDAHNKHSEEWFLKWVKSSSSLIKEGDSVALTIFNEYNKIPMTDFIFLTDEQIKSIIDYIQSESSPLVAAPAPVVQDNTPSAPAEQTNKSTDGLSFIHYILIGTIIILLLTIWTLARAIRQLSNELINSNKNKQSS